MKILKFFSAPFKIIIVKKVKRGLINFSNQQIESCVSRILDGRISNYNLDYIQENKDDFSEQIREWLLFSKKPSRDFVLMKITQISSFKREWKDWMDRLSELDKNKLAEAVLECYNNYYSKGNQPLLHFIAPGIIAESFFEVYLLDQYHLIQYMASKSRLSQDYFEEQLRKAGDRFIFLSHHMASGENYLTELMSDVRIDFFKKLERNEDFKLTASLKTYLFGFFKIAALKWLRINKKNEETELDEIIQTYDAEYDKIEYDSQNILNCIKSCLEKTIGPDSRIYRGKFENWVSQTHVDRTPVIHEDSKALEFIRSNCYYCYQAA